MGFPRPKKLRGQHPLRYDIASHFPACLVLVPMAKKVCLLNFAPETLSPQEGAHAAGAGQDCVGQEGADVQAAAGGQGEGCQGEGGEGAI
eukprot:1184916-Prorocentrum_minimum.AAC.4